VCGILFLGEKNNWKLKAFSILLALFGAYLIKLW
jgi:drug/metabolite transporter (DMT)-like permease